MTFVNLVLVVLFILGLWAIGLSRYVGVIPKVVEDKTTRTDAIVVLTGGSGRLTVGLNLLSKDLADLIIELCGKGNEVEVKTKNSFEGTDRSSSREINVRYCDTERASRILGFSPVVSLREGINNFIDHGVIHPKWATSERDYTIDDSL